nr:MAG TPA: hypothetical protein [Caudoviricetes sp.]
MKYHDFSPNVFYFIIPNSERNFIFYERNF